MKVKTYRGHDINDGTNYISGLKAKPRGLPQVRGRRVTRTGRWPRLSGIDRPGKVLTCEIIIQGVTDAKQKQLAQWFDPENETPGAFVIADDDGSTNPR